MAPQDSKEQTSWWDRLSTPTQVVGAAVAMLAIVVPAFLAVFGNPFSPSPEEVAARSSPAGVAAYEIHKCMRNHGLPAPRTQIADRAIRIATRRTFKRCDWPPLVDSSTDGFTQITERVEPVKSRSLASTYNEVHTLRAPCSALKISFLLDHMLMRLYRDVTMLEGRILLVTTRAAGSRVAISASLEERVPEGVRLDDADPAGIFYVVQTGHVALVDARCVRTG